MAKKPKKIVDPYAKREAENYENPIPSREFILALLTELGKPTYAKQLFTQLELSGDDQTEALRRRLNAMIRDGQLVRNRKGQYGLISKMDLIKGRIVSHRDGHGFVEPENGDERLYLSPKQMGGALHGDLVLARICKWHDYLDRPEAAIVEVVERATTHVVGRLTIEKKIAYVIPEHNRINKDIFIPPDELSGAQHGHIVNVEFIESENSRVGLMGRVVEILGEHLAPGMEIAIALRSYDLPFQWPEAVSETVAKMPDRVSATDRQGRQDLREIPFVTIDGEDARDYDDAVFCEPLAKGGWQLRVAIADVSHYVKPGSALDIEAKNRGNSVYFPGEVIPMLPEKLSNGLCSLKPKVDRLSLVCDMHISAAGQLTDYTFYSAVIHSHARLTYTEVAEYLEGEQENLSEACLGVGPQLEDLFALFEVLHRERLKRGGIEFETKESQFEFDADRKIKNIVAKARNVAHRIIEECMLAANVATAEFLTAHKIPSLYRVHGVPPSTKLTSLRTFLADLSLTLPGKDEPTPKDYAALLASIADRPDYELIQLMLLRSMNFAIYSTENKGHFGLAYPAYTHFTSPIRRYPDLLVHRAIYHVINNSTDRFAYSWENLAVLGEHCSMTERRADEATRDVVDWLKCEFMQDRIGEEFESTITGVTGFGLFVQLKSLFIEGLVHVTALQDDYYHFDSARQQLCGERTGQRYRLQDNVRVKLVRVNLDERQIDFQLSDNDGA